MSKKKPDIWVVLIVVIGFGVFATTRAESSTLDVSQSEMVCASHQSPKTTERLGW